MTDLITDDDGYAPFHARCPKGHVAVQRRYPDEWRTGLASGKLRFYCAECGEHWVPSPEEQDEIRRIVEP